uniref:60S ribosomal protein L35a n=1 Tax=Timspurckia oligopyrenoides TaxID=708627 RepID=A0A7S0ZBM0_9RHOD|mmetsp:Transcript_11526/g.20850  ORF Transcript_11526/g.20850 Transcript_11526/m.20850 type:complete len:114 (+) Transcript_11526:87-428(+)
MGKQPVRLYSKGVVQGYKRGMHNQHPSQARIAVDGLHSRKDVQFYLGKRVAYVYKGSVEKKTVRGKSSKIRVIWGKIIAPHGNSGVVKAKFSSNLPPKSIGGPVRVMLYPSHI